jgi:hypothetical protein
MHLSQFHWNNLSIISLGNHKIIETIINSATQLQVAESIFVEASPFLSFRQFIFDLDEANISKTGCRWLSKANWIQLK